MLDTIRVVYNPQCEAVWHDYKETEEGGVVVAHGTWQIEKFSRGEWSWITAHDTEEAAKVELTLYESMKPKAVYHFDYLEKGKSYICETSDHETVLRWLGLWYYHGNTQVIDFYTYYTI